MLSEWIIYLCCIFLLSGQYLKVGASSLNPLALNILVPTLVISPEWNSFLSRKMYWSTHLRFFTAKDKSLSSFLLGRRQGDDRVNNCCFVLFCQIFLVLLEGFYLTILDALQTKLLLFVIVFGPLPGQFIRFSSV